MVFVSAPRVSRFHSPIALSFCFSRSRIRVEVTPLGVRRDVARAQVDVLIRQPRAGSPQALVGVVPLVHLLQRVVVVLPKRVVEARAASAALTLFLVFGFSIQTFVLLSRASLLSSQFRHLAPLFPSLCSSLLVRQHFFLFHLSCLRLSVFADLLLVALQD